MTWGTAPWQFIPATETYPPDEVRPDRYARLRTTELLPAEAGRLEEIVGDVTAGCHKVAACPQMPAPVQFCRCLNSISSFRERASAIALRNKDRKNGSETASVEPAQFASIMDESHVTCLSKPGNCPKLRIVQRAKRAIVEKWLASNRLS